MVGRPAKSISEHKRDGTFQKCRHSDRDGLESKMSSTIEKPEGMPDSASQHWDKIVPEMQAAGIIKEADEEALKMMCLAWAVCEELYPIYYRNPTDKDARLSYKTAQDSWNFYMQRFGKSPADRSRIKVEAEAEAVIDPFAEFMKNGGSRN